MCDQCDRSARPADKPESDAAITRRTALLLGAGVAAGFFGGLWSCQNNPNRAASSHPFPETDASAPSTTPTTLATSEPQPSPAAESQAATSEPAGTAPATQLTETPDLGSEVFPDSHGIAIAKPAAAPVIVVPRTDWTTARPNLKQIALMDGIARITVHHTAGQMQTDAWRPTAGELEAIREFHSGAESKDRHWADIAYHFAVDRAGRVWQARPLAYQGAHVKGHNEHNLGIVLLGNFEVQSPAAAQLTALSLFVGFLRTLYNVPLGQVFTHGELGMTSCPGKSLQAFMDRARLQWGAREGVAWKPAILAGKTADSDQKPQ